MHYDAMLWVHRVVIMLINGVCFSIIFVLPRAAVNKYSRTLSYFNTFALHNVSLYPQYGGSNTEYIVLNTDITVTLSIKYSINWPETRVWNTAADKLIALSWLSLWERHGLSACVQFLSVHLAFQPSDCEDNSPAPETSNDYQTVITTDTKLTKMLRAKNS